ncbi:hypothetical protein BDW02DRAFT_598447 [Decorospora gaudefroyi]|uniref:WSC domain-containing protein n=1 Tax=Decorospora gaudefroyi TaxID=184978 RepID=A0A6A5KA36_9PLEO|nr:hypothetical protein BDW02DRAFT_598447 [Decorospora gaudefroyi]
MRLSVGLISILLTSAFAVSVPRQNGIPECEDGDESVAHDPGPYRGYNQCLDNCILTEQARNGNYGAVCAGTCKGQPLWGGGVNYVCYGSP